MTERIINNGQGTEQEQGPPEAEAPGPAAAAGPAPCADCLSGRSLMVAAMFAAFAAYVTADFFTGGRLTAALLGLLASARGGNGGHDG